MNFKQCCGTLTDLIVSYFQHLAGELIFFACCSNFSSNRFTSNIVFRSKWYSERITPLETVHDIIFGVDRELERGNYAFGMRLHEVSSSIFLSTCVNVQNFDASWEHSSTSHFAYYLRDYCSVVIFRKLIFASLMICFNMHSEFCVQIPLVIFHRIIWNFMTL